MIGLNGYVYFLVYMSLIVMFGMVLLLGSMFSKKLNFFHYLANCTIVLLLGLLGLAVGSWTLVHEKIAVCVECDKVIMLLEKYKDQHGTYPDKIDDINIRIVKGIKVQQGKFLNGGSINIGNINNSDVTIYLTPKVYSCVVPVTKVFPMSFTRFYVFQKNNQMKNWVYEKYIWSLTSIK
ncbi:MAG: hypothetical protein COA79_21500 [Planctomycetota bacterium]|nr:MAG: hypothetical protein COA79_21500 [Planctomycetota bacterium]